eukprot:6423831-Prymnesium_polylepis.1
MLQDSQHASVDVRKDCLQAVLVTGQHDLDGKDCVNEGGMVMSRSDAERAKHPHVGSWGGRDRVGRP